METTMRNLAGETKGYTLQLPVEIYEKMKEIAKKESVSIALLMQRAIVDYLKRKEKNA